MVLGFISLLLIVFQGALSRICIPEHLTRKFLPCEKETEISEVETSAHFQTFLFSGILGTGRHLLAEESSKCLCAKKVLDSPSLQDDFYLNLVDWSSQNVLAVGLGACVYLWTATNSKVTKLCDLGPNDCVSAVQWTREGSYLSIGTNLGEVQIWDGSQCKRVQTMGGHQTITGIIAWNPCILSFVCGLKWSHDDRELASGGNDNQLLIWNQHSQQPVLRLTEHTVAVKAIAWSPHQNGILESGSGTADRCIRFWNTSNGNQ